MNTCSFFFSSILIRQEIVCLQWIMILNVSYLQILVYASHSMHYILNVLGQKEEKSIIRDTKNKVLWIVSKLLAYDNPSSVLFVNW